VHSSPHITGHEMKVMDHVARMGEMIVKASVGKHEKKRPFGRVRHRR
jgi:hypothetical protein